jgi:hypothetical protein
VGDILEDPPPTDERELQEEFVGFKNNIKSKVSRSKPNNFDFVLKNHNNSHRNRNQRQAFPV